LPVKDGVHVVSQPEKKRLLRYLKHEFVGACHGAQQSIQFQVLHQSRRVPQQGSQKGVPIHILSPGIPVL
jgi:hypothetical protein